MAQILVIDDDASLLQMMSLMLKRAGHEPILAYDGREGIKLARSKKPDMAVVDLMMPDLSGYEVCRILRQDPATEMIPLLVLTALSQPEQRDMAEEAGADDFVTKPVTRDDLVTHVDELLRTGPRNVPVPIEPMTERIPGLDYSGMAGAPPPMPQETPTGPLTQPYPGPILQPVQAAPLPLVAIMGLGSGVGATTIAVNLAQALAQRTRTCIVDLNTQTGQVAAQLRMVPLRASWLDLVGIAPGADKRIIGSKLMMNQALGMAILAGPLQAVDARMSEDSLSYVLSVLSEGFHYIVADLPPVLNVMNVTTLYRAEYIVLVVGDDPVRLVTVPEMLKNLDQMRLPGKMLLALNRSRPHGISDQDVMRAINRPLVAHFPYEPAQVQALTQGQPLVVAKPDSPFSQAILQLAIQL